MRFKGQAFETMMLVISVIVALAILGVLLNILGGINFGVGNPTDVMQKNLQQVYSKGYSAGTPAQRSTFDQGNIITAKDAIGNLPIDPSDVRINCPSTDTVVCGTTKLSAGNYANGQGDNQVLRVNGKVDAYIVVCGDSNNGAGTTGGAPHYCVGLGSTAANAVNACGNKADTSSCQLFS